MTELVRLGGAFLWTTAGHKPCQSGKEHMGGDGVQVRERAFAGAQNGTGLCVSTLSHTV